MISVFIIIFFLLGPAKSLVFKCQTKPITASASDEGVIPTNATVPTNVTAGTDCFIHFEVPRGYALRFETRVKGNNGSDIFELVDPLGKTHDQDLTLVYEDVWFTEGKGLLKIASPKGAMSFIVKYYYKQLSDFFNNTIPTGTVLPVELRYFTTYKFFSPTNDRIAISVAPKNPTNVIGKHIFVYDGENIANATMIGTLADLMKGKDRVYSKGAVMHLVDFYGLDEPKGVIVVNDASTVANLTSYSVVLVVDGTVNKTILPGGACTFISVKSNFLNLRNMTIATKTGKAQLQGQLPNHRLKKVIEYTNDLDTRFPQTIPTKVITVYAINANVSLSVAPENKLNQTLIDNQKGVVVSQNLWGDVKNSGDYGWIKLVSDKKTQFYNFTIEFDKIEFNDSKTSISVKIDDQYQRFSMANKPTGSFSGVGTSCNISIENAVNTTDIRLSYSAQKTTFIPTTSEPIQSTTKSGNVASIFVSFSIALILFFN